MGGGFNPPNPFFIDLTLIVNWNSLLFVTLAAAKSWYLVFNRKKCLNQDTVIQSWEAHKNFANYFLKPKAKKKRFTDLKCAMSKATINISEKVKSKTKK